MLQSYPIFAGEKLPDMTDNSFVANETFWLTDESSDDLLYQQIVGEVLRRPKALILHLRRIYFIRSKKKNAEQLYGALVDLLWVLNGRGKALSKRMVLFGRPLLSDKQFKLLAEYLLRQNDLHLLGNKFSVLTDGVVGTRCLVSKQARQEDEHDPLDLAYDFIEFSQLDEAIETLEKGMLVEPTRMDIQNQLLELYKVTRNVEAFTKMHNSLIEKRFDLSKEWQDLATYFSGINE